MEVSRVLASHLLQMPRQIGLDGRREHRDPILRPLAVPDDDQVCLEVDVLDAQAGAFEQA